MAGPTIKPTGGGLSTQLWDPDVIPTGLHELSWHPGDSLDSFDYLSDEAGTCSSDDYGITIGTVSSAWGGPFIALPAGDCSVTTRYTMGYQHPFTSFVAGGMHVGNLVGQSTSTVDIVRLIQEWNNTITPDIRAQYYTNGVFSAHLLTVTRPYRGFGAIYRIGINAARTTANLMMSLDNGHSFVNYYSYTPGTVTLNGVGIQLYASPASTPRTCRWFRVRTGTDEHENTSPEGGLLI